MSNILTIFNNNISGKSITILQYIMSIVFVRLIYFQKNIFIHTRKSKSYYHFFVIDKIHIILHFICQSYCFQSWFKKFSQQNVFVEQYKLFLHIFLPSCINPWASKSYPRHKILLCSSVVQKSQIALEKGLSYKALLESQHDS